MQTSCKVPAGVIALLLACQSGQAFQFAADAITNSVLQARPARACDTNDAAGCGENMFCSRPAGTCGEPDVKGMCLPVPSQCPDSVKPVCGCDGNTYRNRCEAALAGASIAHHGSCVRRCDRDGQRPCNLNEFCNFPPGSCADATSTGVCTPIPQLCAEIIAPVCGCDGVSYQNRCKAAAAGVSVAHGGRCPQRCDATHACDRGDFCELPSGACSVNNAAGVCRPRPDACPGVMDPVCGCDGQTYSNKCEAAAAGVNIAHAGPCLDACGRVNDPPCEDDEFCRLPPGACRLEGRGECLPIPTECTEQFQPVCGCDGMTYPNECFASKAGVSVGHRGPCARRCTRTLPCADGEFCQFEIGACDDPAAVGVCAPTPQGCPDVWEPVCGCDGMTYGNRCEASNVGMSIAHLGACRRDCNPWSLGPARQCLDDEYCRLPTGACHNTETLGVCTPIPEICPLEPTGVSPCRPVCGCDGNTYCSECEAGMASVSIAHFGECQQACDPASPAACKDSEYCQVPPGVCDSQDTRGMCAPVPDGCPDVWEPVCGCDGKTYSNACDAAANRVSIRHRGECELQCGGIAGFPCDDGEFCKYPPGMCEVADLAGVCRPLVDACPAIFDPVCGCDGETYSNECEADRAGAQIRHRGPCGATCEPSHDANDPSCPAGQFCLIPPASCGSMLIRGVCTDIPENCPDVYEPVCGCDGTTYANRCEAWRRQVSIDYAGACVRPCDREHPCEDGSFCHFSPGTCGGPGVIGECETVPDQCPTNYEPVCGCNGQTYANRCEAARAGVSIRANGPCGQRCSPRNSSGLAPCQRGEYCQLPSGACHDPDATGVCAARPTSCPVPDPAAEPVCGCDGLTYRNRCAAAMSGVSVDHPGPCAQICGGIAGLPCDKGEFCKLPAAMCHVSDLAGVCRTAPSVCPTIYQPVCGCDGVTYANECEADRAGVAMDHRGECSE